MNEIIHQIEQILVAENKADPKQSGICACREIVLSGMSRAGILKDFCYLPDLDRYDNGIYGIIFLNQNEHKIASFSDCLSVVKNELNAFGVDFKITEKENGFCIETGENKLVVFFYTKEFHLKPVYRYIQTPLAFELISIETMNESIKDEIRQMMEKEVFENSKAKKKGASKAPGKKKLKKEQDNHWVQPSLFDF